MFILYRIGILLDSLTIQAWQVEAIRKLLSTGLVEFSVLVVNQSPKPSGRPSPFLYRVYRKLDRIFFKDDLDAFESVPLSKVISSKVPVLSTKPIQTKYRDSFSDKDIEKIASYDLDIVIRFGFRILSGEILKVPKLGVWSYHHGDPKVYRGGPPAFWEVMKQIPATGCVLMRLNEKLDKGEILYESHTQTDPLSVQRNANRIFWASAAFPARVVREIDRLGMAGWCLNVASKAIDFSAPLLKPPQTRSMLRMGTNLFLRNLKRKTREQFKAPHWDIGWISDLSINRRLISTRGAQLIKREDGNKYYLADPFPIFYQGRLWVFVEQFDKKRKKGIIAIMDEEGNCAPVIEEEWHLSYPFVWEENGAFWMLPESAEAGKLWLYQAISFPFKWERKQELFSEEAYDPTLWKTEQGYWLFVNQKSHPACSPFDELSLYFSKSLSQPSWQSHSRNPIVSDVRSSRPAGSLFEENGKFYRPAQDSEKRYGHRIRVMEVKSLSLDSYREEEAYRIEPNEKEGTLGIHTMNRIGDRRIFDFYSRK
ncbi:MAG TPA: hypothetical protein DEQ87_05720 [Algoriphagus sp.]|uniref:glucosamine inositolphosphorylceramide transferase family protein n=1 Tax=unclassified Algoriphagus TaxID=2641541 RepID=UPI000C5D353A|nr:MULTISPECIES: formyltransferase family protein [unclassified Algoriphagus]MAL14004.1 hypothetical protein [Algoriphagus sp.]MAN85635.1 hypothetical protein [Algoriphagus sp.]QYH38014.1 hypothetical protein GYM62_04080 [Algoriphagus sp. NBT04N3]HAS61010.1 hypothetical protein [Algoriphagus sp.]HCB45431.1 hypothetical protein [Algoriphagus sp.]